MHKNKNKQMYSIPSLDLEKHDTEELLSLIKIDIFYRVDKYKNSIEHQPLNKKISTCLDYEKIHLEE